MADKRIQDLTPATSVELSDRFVLEQSGQAKSLTGQVLINDLATALDGHGGISNISYTDPTSPNLNGTLTITMADETEYYLDITNGRGITNITWDTSGTAGDGMIHTGTIDYNDGTSSTVTFQDGVRGSQGVQTYVWFKWSDVYPTADTDMQNNVGAYIGIYSGVSSTAPTHYTDYIWYQYKGDTGDTGASIQSISKISTSGLVDTYQVLLTNGNTSNFTVTNAKSIVSVTMTSGSHAAGTSDVYTITFNDGDTAQFSVYNGTNGTGAVSSVSGIQADGNGDVPQVISGNGPPTTATIGQTNQLYYDLSNSILYYCVGEGGGTYVWQGAGVTVDSSLSGSSTNPVQNRVITNRIGTGALPNSSTDLTTAINYVNGVIPATATTTPLADTSGGAVGTGTNWAKNDHQHPLNVATSGVPAMDGTASLGSATTYAKTDHVHPTDTSRVAKAGDTITGVMNFEDAVNIKLEGNFVHTDASYSSPPSSNSTRYFWFTDSEDRGVGYLRSTITTAGKVYSSFCARRRDTSDTTVSNILELGVDASGNRTVDVTEAAPWLTALGLGNPTTTTTASSIVTPASGFSISSAEYHQWGKLAMITVVFKKTTAVTTASSMNPGTVVSGKRPIAVANAGSSDIAITEAHINSSGAMYMYGTWAANATKRITATYLLP